MNIDYGQIITRKYTIAMLLCILLSVCFILTVPSVSAKEYLPPTYEYTTNFYKSYGEPDISATVLGDTEFERGETARLEVVLSNRGVLYGVKADEDVGTSETLHKLSLLELQYESLRTTAYGLKASLVSPTDMIDIDPGTNSHTLSSLSPGVLPDDPMSFTITISEYIPAGIYILELPVSYEYQNDVRMTVGQTSILGEPDLDHASYYKNVNETLQIPIVVKPQANFEVSNVSGTLVSGKTGVINVTYTNIGELPAKDAIARIVVMKPLSAERSTKSLGDIQPGESKTVSFTVSSEIDSMAKTYGIDSEIKYYEEDGDEAFSRNMKANIDLKDNERTINVTGVALAGIFVIIVVMIVKKRKKNVSD